MNRCCLMLLAPIIGVILGGKCVVGYGDEESRTPSTVITILHTCDFHGRHVPFVVGPGNATSQTGNPNQPENRFEREGEIGGFAALAAAVNDIRRERGEQNVLLLHAGDTFSDDLLGNLTQGEAVIRLMNAVGYDYMALGNHDFDYGVNQTRHLQEIATFPMRAANVTNQETGEPIFGKPFKVFRVGKVAVGVLTIGYHNTDQTTAAKNIRGLQFIDGIEVAGRYVPQLRRQADVVVVLSHQGTAVDERLAEKVSGIDLIVGGHSHDRLHPARKVNGTTIVQAMSDTAALGEVRFKITNGQIETIEDELHMLWTDVFSDDAVARQIDAMRRPHREQLEQIIGTVAAPIARQYKRNSPFDILVAELLRQHAGTDLALLPGVGYGITLQPGVVRRESLYALLPHPVKVVSLTLTGKQIRNTLEQSVENLTTKDPRQHVGGLIQSSGLTWTVNLDSSEASKIKDVKIGGVALDEAKRYTVATHSGMLQGIHRYKELKQDAAKHAGGKKVIEVVEDYFRSSQMVSPPDSESVTFVDW